MLHLMMVVAMISEGDVPGPFRARWDDAVTYARPDDGVANGRIERATGWLTGHLEEVVILGVEGTVPVVAWKDPTLEPERSGRLAGYLITDTLWAAKALRAVDAEAAGRIEEGLVRVGWYGNGLHEVLFRGVERPLHRSDDADPMHGHSLGHFALGGGREVDVRVFRQRWDTEFAVGHPFLFAEHAVYQTLHDHWAGRSGVARERLLGVLANTGGDDQIFWDEESGILVDQVTRGDWWAFRDGQASTCPHYTFKLGVVLYAVRVMGLEAEAGPRLDRLKARLWDAQIDSGGLVHFVDVGRDGVAGKGEQPTGEATAIGILSETVRPH